MAIDEIVQVGLAHADQAADAHDLQAVGHVAAMPDFGAAGPQAGAHLLEGEQGVCFGPVLCVFLHMTVFRSGCAQRVPLISA